MTHYYVDQAAAGTGDGTSPTNARTHISGVSSFADGDMIWIRRTHVESDNNNVNIGADFRTYRRAFFIGWPSSGDPFYDSRPAAGVSAGWDSDHAATGVYSVFGLDFPTLSCSGATAPTGLIVRPGNVFANICFNQIQNAPAVSPLQSVNSLAYLDNIIFLNQFGVTGQVAINAMAFSARFGTLHIADNIGGLRAIHARQMIVHSLSSVNSGLLWGQNANNNQHYIDHLINYSSSVSHLVRANDGFYSITAPWGIIIGRASGVQPYSGAVNPPAATTNCAAAYVRIDDYYGAGPRITGHSGVQCRLATSAEAMYNGARTVLMQISSIGATVFHYGDMFDMTRPIRAFISVTSGTPVGIGVPCYVDSTAVLSLSNGLMIGHLQCLGSRPIFITASNLIAGSSSLWSGTFAAGGTAYSAVMTVTPIETGLFPFEITAPTRTESSQAIAYALFGRPWSVSS